LDGSETTPSSTGTGTASFGGLSAETAYTVQVVATNSDGFVNSSITVTTLAEGAPYLNGISLSSNPVVAYVDELVTLTAGTYDQFNNPFPGATVSLTSDTGTSATMTDDGNGVHSYVTTHTASAVVNYEASVNLIRETFSVTYIPNATGSGPASSPTSTNFTLTFPVTGLTAQIQFTYDPAIGYASNGTSMLDGNIIYDTGAVTATTISPYTDSLYVELLAEPFSDPSIGTYIFRMKMPQWFLNFAILEIQAANAPSYNRYINHETCAFTFTFVNNVYQGTAIDGLPGNILGTVGITLTGSNII
jgi:hypothetical protein